MTTGLYSETELKALLTPDVSDVHRFTLINVLAGAGLYTYPDDGSKILVDVGTNISTPDPNAGVLVELGVNNTVYVTSALKAIVLSTSADGTLVIEGNTPVFVTTGNGNYQIFNNDPAGVEIQSGDGNDTIYAGSGADTIYGGGGNNVLIDQQSGKSTLAVDSGDNLLYGFGHDILLAGSGHDTLYGGANSQLFGNKYSILVSGSVSGSSGNVLHGGLVQYGGSGNDTLVGGATQIAGIAGDQYLQGGSLIIGNAAGNDTLTGGAGASAIYSYSDSDHASILTGVGSNDSLYAGAGQDSMYGAGQNELLVGGARTVIMQNTLAHSTDVMYSGSDADHGTVLIGNSGADSLYAGAGADSLYGGSGNELLVGGATTALMVSGSLTPSYNGEGVLVSGTGVLYSGSDASHATALHGGAGADSLYAGGGADSLYGGSGTELLVGAAHTELLQASQTGYGKTTIYSGSVEGGGSRLYGGNGWDTLYGGAGNDTLYGGSGVELLIAGSGTQTLFSGPFGGSLVGSATGTASMVGGAGQDYFYLSNPNSNDTIDGGGGSLDSITFYDHAKSDLAGTTPGSTAGAIELHFTNSSQVIEIKNVEYLFFTDGYTKL